MAAQPKYITQPDFDKALSAFSGYIDHTINMTKAEIRREIVESEDRLRAEIHASEDRLRAEIQTQIHASEDRLQAQINDLKLQVDRVENIGKSNHQMFQIMLDQFSKINKKLGID